MSSGALGQGLWVEARHDGVGGADLWVTVQAQRQVRVLQRLLAGGDDLHELGQLTLALGLRQLRTR
jgi:hypothetical protein